jgi:uncharacterized protein YcnI
MMPRKRWSLALGIASLPLLLCAHATVSPSTSRPGAYERYVLRVPNESDNPTVGVEIRFPADVRVISFADVPGWQLQTVKDTTGRAVTATWTGTLPPDRFVEFPFVGVNPQQATRVSWPVVQTYANGQRVEWAGPVGSDLPASVTEIGGGESKLSVPIVLGGLALLIALAALGVAWRQPKP